MSAPPDGEPDLYASDIPFSASGMSPERSAQHETRGFEPLSAIAARWVDRVVAEWAQYSEAHRTAYHVTVHYSHGVARERDRALATAERWREELRRYTAAQVGGGR